MEILAKTSVLLVLVCLLISCGGESFAPGEMQYTWNPTYADLYINDKLALRGDFLLDHGSGAGVTIEAVMHPEDGWRFDRWEFTKQNGFLSGSDFEYSEENPYSFNVGDHPQHLYLSAERFQTGDFTVSENGEKVFMTFRSAGNTKAGIYSLKDKKLNLIKDERYTEYTIDPFGRVFCLDRELEVLYILDWEKEEFEELITDFPSTRILGGYDGEAYSFSWSPDMNKCAYIFDNYEIDEHLLCVLDRASGSVTTKVLVNPRIDELKWSLDSKFLYAMIDMLTNNGLSRSRICRYEADSLLESEIFTYTGEMKTLSGPDAYGNFYFLDPYCTSGEYPNCIYKLNESDGVLTLLFNLDEFEKIPGDIDNYTQYPSIMQYKGSITITTDFGVYLNSPDSPILIFPLGAASFIQGDAAIPVPGSPSFLIKTLQNYAYDLYLYTIGGEEERITKPECFL